MTKLCVPLLAGIVILGGLASADDKPPASTALEDPNTARFDARRFLSEVVINGVRLELYEPVGGKNIQAFYVGPLKASIGPVSNILATGDLDVTVMTTADDDTRHAIINALPSGSGVVARAPIREVFCTLGPVDPSEQPYKDIPWKRIGEEAHSGETFTLHWHLPPDVTSDTATLLKWIGSTSLRCRFEYWSSDAKADNETTITLGATSDRIWEHKLSGNTTSGSDFMSITYLTREQIMRALDEGELEISIDSVGRDGQAAPLSPADALRMLPMLLENMNKAVLSDEQEWDKISPLYFDGNDVKTIIKEYASERAKHEHDVRSMQGQAGFSVLGFGAMASGASDSEHSNDETLTVHASGDKVIPPSLRVFVFRKQNAKHLASVSVRETTLTQTAIAHRSYALKLATPQPIKVSMSPTKLPVTIHSNGEWTFHPEFGTSLPRRPFRMGLRVKGTFHPASWSGYKFVGLSIEGSVNGAGLSPKTIDALLEDGGSGIRPREMAVDIDTVVTVMPSPTGDIEFKLACPFCIGFHNQDELNAGRGSGKADDAVSSDLTVECEIEPD
jgi:hypothetical protein